MSITWGRDKYLSSSSCYRIVRNPEDAQNNSMTERYKIYETSSDKILLRKEGEKII